MSGLEPAVVERRAAVNHRPHTVGGHPDAIVGRARRADIRSHPVDRRTKDAAVIGNIIVVNGIVNLLVGRLRQEGETLIDNLVVNRDSLVNDVLEKIIALIIVHMGHARRHAIGWAVKAIRDGVRMNRFRAEVVRKKIESAIGGNPIEQILRLANRRIIHFEFRRIGG